MKTQTIVWSIIFVVAGAFLVHRAFIRNEGMGKAYVKAVPMQFVNVAASAGEDPKWVRLGSPAAADIDAPRLESATDRIEWTRYSPARQRDYQAAITANPAQTEFRLSIWRTFGIWVAAFFTLAVLSFVYKDNPFYKIAESVFVGVSAAYWMVVGFWTVVVPNLIGKLWPSLIKAWALPGLSGPDVEPDWWYIAPAVLGIMLLWRLAPVGGWIARWPLAFIIGVFCGLRLLAFLHGDFLNQIRNSIVPLAVMTDGSFDVWASLANVLLVLGVLTCLVYFFFSMEHKGIAGKTARVGIWVLMITFGAGFGYTVMGRIALLAIRLEFLFDDWMWLIDPTGKRIAMLM
jgi:hypothetical protein